MDVVVALAIACAFMRWWWRMVCSYSCRRDTPLSKARAVLDSVEDGQHPVAKIRTAAKTMSKHISAAVVKASGGGLTWLRRARSQPTLPPEQKAVVQEAVDSYDAVVKKLHDHVKTADAWTAPVMVQKVAELLQLVAELESAAAAAHQKSENINARTRAARKERTQASRKQQAHEEKVTEEYRKRGVPANFCCWLRTVGAVRSADTADVDYTPSRSASASCGSIDWCQPHWFHNEERDDGGQLTMCLVCACVGRAWRGFVSRQCVHFRGARA